jgi:hypothetical protein
LNASGEAPNNLFPSPSLSIFPLLGYGVFEKTETMKKPRDVLVIDAKAVHASGYEGPKGFVVCKGSQAVKDDVRPEGQRDFRRATRR